MAAAGLAADQQGARPTGRSSPSWTRRGTRFGPPRHHLGAEGPAAHPEAHQLRARGLQRGRVGAPLDGPAQLSARHFRGSIHAEEVIAALRSFCRRVGRPLSVVWDRLGAHPAKPVEAFVAAHAEDFRLEWLPRYAPDLDPEELGNGAVKREVRNAAAVSVDQLLHLARRVFSAWAAARSSWSTSSITQVSALPEHREAH